MSNIIHDLKIVDNTILLSDTSLDFNVNNEIDFDTSGGIEITNDINLNNNEIQNAQNITSTNNLIIKGVSSTSNIRVKTNNTTNRMRLFQLSSLPQITFSSNPETLTAKTQTLRSELMTMNSFMTVITTFTPALNSSDGGTGQTYSTSSTYCRYVKMGNIVYMSYRVTLTSKGALVSTGDVRLTLPLTSSNRNSLVQGLCIGSFLNVLGSMIDVYCQVQPNTTYCNILKKTVTTGTGSITTSPLLISDIDFDFGVSLGGFYYTS